ncbi:MAG: VapC toxin family PIN domain ribonuclease [Gemmatimonadetes bacterium]|nr:VapC toxin family PIN domain ribonuclease [Gemmatimonadota bacterium]
MFVVDTNLLIYAADRSFEEHEPCRGLLEQWLGQASAWYSTWGILYEFVRVTTHRRVFRSPWSAVQAWAFVDALLASPSFSVLVETERHPVVARSVLDEVPDLRGNLVHDGHTAVLMREHGIRTIYTRDTDFHRFPFVEVRDPLRQ